MIKSYTGQEYKEAEANGDVEWFLDHGFRISGIDDIVAKQKGDIVKLNYKISFFPEDLITYTVPDHIKISEQEMREVCKEVNSK